MASVEQQLGSPLESAQGRATVFEVELTEAEPGWIATIVTQTDGGRFERTLPPTQTCAEASEAAALVVAIAVDSEAPGPPAPPPTESEAESVPEPPPSSEPEPAPQPQLQPQPQPQPRSEPKTPTTASTDDRAPRRSTPRTPAGGAIGILGGGGWGVIDQATFATGLWAALRLRRVRVFVDGLFTPRRDVSVRDAAVRFRQWSVAAGGCPTFLVAPAWALEPCAALEVGQVIAQPRQLDNSSDISALWLAARIGPRVAWGFHDHVAALLGADLLVPINRPSFEVGGFGSAARPPSVGVRAWLAVEFRFGSKIP